jgi:hypothetical protein
MRQTPNISEILYKSFKYTIETQALHAHIVEWPKHFCLF